MRCPKCSYISFDYAITCLKCRYDLEKVSSQLHGTAMKVQAPSFLGPALLALAAKARAEEAGATIPLPDSLPEVTLAEEAPALELSMEQEAGEAPDIVMEVPGPVTTEAPDIVTTEAPAPAAMPVDDQPDIDLEGLLAEETPVAETPAAEVPAAEARAAEAPEETPPVKQPEIKMEAPAGETETPRPATLQFEGLDLSDLAPESGPETASQAQNNGDGEGVDFDIWSFDSDSPDFESQTGLPSGDELLEDLLHPGKAAEDAHDVDLKTEGRGEEGKG